MWEPLPPLIAGDCTVLNDSVPPKKSIKINGGKSKLARGRIDNYSMLATMFTKQVEVFQGFGHLIITQEKVHLDMAVSNNVLTRCR